MVYVCGLCMVWYLYVCNLYMVCVCLFVICVCVRAVCYAVVCVVWDGGCGMYVCIWFVCDVT